MATTIHPAPHVDIPSWKSHKIVRADRVKHIEAFGTGDASPGKYLVYLDGGARVEVKPDVFARGKPQIRDFLVIYDDGYVSWSPAKAFEDGYTLLAANCPTCGEAVSSVFEHVDRACGHESSGIKHEIEQLREEVAFWRRDAAARLWGYMASAKASAEVYDDIRAADLRANHIMPTLAALRDADGKEWHSRCMICGEFIKPTDDLRAVAVDDDDTESVHARCGDPDSPVYRHEALERDAKVIAEAKRFVGWEGAEDA